MISIDLLAASSVIGKVQQPLKAQKYFTDILSEKNQKYSNLCIYFILTKN